MADLYTRTWDDILEDCEELEDIQTKADAKFRAKFDFEFFLDKILGLRVDSDLIKDLIDLVENPPDQPDNKITKIARLAPRGHSKTYTSTVGQALWRAYSEQGIKILIVSATREQATGILDEEIKRFINRNEALQHLKPSTEFLNQMQDSDSVDIDKDEAKWAAQSITTTTDVRIKAKPFSSSIRSMHMDYVLCDDLLSDEESGTRDVEAEKNLYYNVITPTAESQGEWIQVVGTPQKHNDLIMELIDKDEYDTGKYQAHYENEEGEREVLWEHDEVTDTGWTYDGLMSKKAEIGSARFAKEYMCNPMSVDEQFFDYDTCIQPNLYKNLKADHWKPKIGSGAYDDWEFAVGVDIALQDGEGADYTVFQVLGKDPEGQVWHVDIHRERGMTPKSIAEKLKALDEVYSFKTGYVEKNAIGEGVWKTIKERANDVTYRVEAFDTTRKTRPKILSNLQAGLEGQKLVLKETGEMIDEMMAFRLNNKNKLEGKGHDDTVMSLAIAWHAVDDGGTVEASVALIGADGSEDGEFEDDEEDVVGPRAEASGMMCECGTMMLELNEVGVARCPSCEHEEDLEEFRAKKQIIENQSQNVENDDGVIGLV